MNTETALCRIYRQPYKPSSQFSSLPWMSDFMLKDDEAIRSAFLEIHPKILLSKPLVDALMDYQKMLVSNETLTTPNFYFWKWMTGKLDETTLSSGSGIHNSGRANVLSVIMAYRVLETAHMVYCSSFTMRQSNGVNQPPDVIKLVDAVKKLIQQNGEVLNWVEFLRQAKGNADTIWSKEDQDIGGDEFQPASSRLIHSVIQNSRMAHGYCLLANIETAAAHLLYLVSEGELDIPEVSKLVQKLGISLKDESVSYVNNSLGKANFQQPLYFALAVSPIWLLMDSLMSGKSFQKVCTKACLLNAWLFSPLKRSERFIKVENRLWGAIFEIADGIPTKTALGKFFENLDFQELSVAAVADETCFVGSGNKGPASPASEIKALDAPEDSWPLSPLLTPEAASSSRKRIHGEDSSTIKESQSKKMRANLDRTAKDGHLSPEKNMDYGQEGLPDPTNWNATPSADGYCISGSCNVSTSLQSQLGGPLDVFQLAKITVEDSPVILGACQNTREHWQEDEPGAVSIDNVKEDELEPLQDTRHDTDFQLHGNSKPEVLSWQGGRVNGKHRDISKGETVSKKRGLLKNYARQAASTVTVGVVDKVPHRGNAKAEEDISMKQHPGDLLISESSYEALCNDKKDWPNVDAKDQFEVQRIQGQESISYPVPGLPNEVISYQPEAHLEKELSWLYALENQAVKLHSSIPMYAASLEHSCLSIMSGKDWNGLTHLQRQKLFSTKDILILDSEIEGVVFDRDLLLSVAGSMDRVVTVQDHSGDELEFSGNMDIIYRHSQDCNGLVLSALDLPATEAFPPSRSLSTDVCAFLATMGRQYCNQNCHQYPQRSMRWNDCALKHANSRFDIGPNGFAKYKRVICGAELLFLASLVEEVSVGDIDIFFSENYDGDLPPRTRWIVEAVPILPGSTVYIRPCRPHAVVALEHTVCHGGYLYSWSTIRDTCFGILHDFGTGLFFSSAERVWDSRELIRRIVTYFHMHFVEGRSQSDPGHHLPDLADFKEVVGLLCLLNIATLGHLIYLPFYQEKVSLFDSSHQNLFSVTRQKAGAILGYMERNVLFRKDGMELEFKPLFRTYFVQQVRTLIRQCSTRQPEDKSSIVQGETPIFQKFTEAVAASFYGKRWFVKEMGRQRKINYPDTSYAWISDELFVTSVRNAYSASEDILKESRIFNLEFPTNLAYDNINKEMCSLFDMLHPNPSHPKFTKVHPVVG